MTANGYGVSSGRLSVVDAASYLTVQNLRKAYPGSTTPAVADATLTLERGRMLTLLGPSGCGKTTLLRMLAGLTTPDSGQVLVGGRSMIGVPLHKRNMGMVFQSYALFPHLDVARNIAFGLEVRGIKDAACRKRVSDMMDLMHLGGLEHRRVADLSGGQRQRVALARALAIEPDILLLDEPLANLDVKLRGIMRDEIRSLQRRLGITSVFVTHDQEEALSIADVVAVMSDGHVRQIGTPVEIYDRPASRFVASFVGRSNFLFARYGGSGSTEVEGLGPVPLPADIPPWEGPGILLVRPHHVQLGAPQADAYTCSAIVEDIVYTGDRYIVAARAGQLRLCVEQGAPLPAGVSIGQDVQLSWLPRDMRLVAEDTV
ncbi:ABC transporter ATP-binding protein [Acetobacter sp. TBRC 12305]|uniref:ABC transporter ATP-binding protein n=1 Tax=Acetobacter garciniae TaxID=2817435 RepID=A0A939KNE8_9PROT|nr:ABC transporter ATP-binding protein [Acetobacter garciniae]MBX0346391.1 ABC transporter ATP-binding protein [Acetobacter garciniae]